MQHFYEDFYNVGGDYEQIINYDWPSIETLNFKIMF